MLGLTWDPLTLFILKANPALVFSLLQESEREKREIQKGERKLTFSPRQGGGNEVGILAVDAVSPAKCRFLAPVTVPALMPTCSWCSC